MLSSDEIIEEREELMAPVTGGVLQMRDAYFLRPTVSYRKAPSLKLPTLPPKSDWPLQVNFNGWRDPQKNWDKWVEHMQSKHGELWKKVGIFDAIMFSKYRFHRHDELILGVVERWCCDTNTFFFPWGEGTITLEDALILGGFPVLGGPVFLAGEGKELEEAEDALKGLPLDLRHHDQWFQYFMKSGRENEHEAFLALWLSRFVFPGNEYDKIGLHVFSIAVNLSRGMRIALAPAVLASIYKDLGLLKESMAVSTKLEPGSGEFLAVGLWAPLQMVQLWVWERFLDFRPPANFLQSGDIRAARWHNAERYEIGNVRALINTCVDTFSWRPYSLTVDEWPFPEFYKRKELLFEVDQSLDEQVESFARSMRVSVLVGIDCAESYQPHRVAMQFGLDQDIPKMVPRWFGSIEIAWIDYSKPFRNGLRLYLPARLSEPDFSAQYHKWWTRIVQVPVTPVPGVRRRPRTLLLEHLTPRTRVNRRAGHGDNAPVARSDYPTDVQIKVEPFDPDVPPGFQPKRTSVSTCLMLNDPDVPPGFLPKRASDPDVLLGFLPKKTADSTSAVKRKAPGKDELTGKGNDSDVPPGFQPKRTAISTAKTETGTRNEVTGNVNGSDPDVPPGFQPRRASDSTSLKRKTPPGNNNDPDVPPGFQPKKPANSIVTTETWAVHGITGNVNDVNALLGSQPKRTTISTMKLEARNGKDADVPPRFPCKSKCFAVLRLDMFITEQNKNGGYHSEDSLRFLGEKDDRPVLKPEAPAKLQNKEEPSNHGGQILGSESSILNQIKETELPHFSVIKFKKYKRAPPPSTPPIQAPRPPTSTVRVSAGKQNPRPLIRTVNTRNAAIAAVADSRKNANLTPAFATVKKHGGRQNSTSPFSTAILSNSGSRLKP